MGDTPASPLILILQALMPKAVWPAAECLMVAMFAHLYVGFTLCSSNSDFGMQLRLSWVWKVCCKTIFVNPLGRLSSYCRAEIFCRWCARISHCYAGSIKTPTSPDISCAVTWPKVEVWMPCANVWSSTSSCFHLLLLCASLQIGVLVPTLCSLNPRVKILLKNYAELCTQWAYSQP